MKYCAKCGTALNDNSPVCPSCGFSFNNVPPQGGPSQGQIPPQGGPGFGQVPPQGGPGFGQVPPQGGYQGGPAYGQPVMMDPTDHTDEMDPRDISDNKVVAMLPYLFGIIGVIVCALLSRESKYASFHVRQALKLEVCSMLVSILTLFLIWTIIVPIAGIICGIILFVIRIIGFFGVAGGKAKELPIIKGFGFLK